MDGCDEDPTFFVVPARSSADLDGLGVPGDWWYVQLAPGFAAVVARWAGEEQCGSVLEQLSRRPDPALFARFYDVDQAECAVVVEGRTVRLLSAAGDPDPVGAGLAAIDCPVPRDAVVAAVRTAGEVGEPVAGYDVVDQCRLGPVRIRLRSMRTRAQVVGMLDGAGYHWAGAEREAQPLTLRATRLPGADEQVYTLHFRAGVVAEIRVWYREPPAVTG